MIAIHMYFFHELYAKLRTSWCSGLSNIKMKCGEKDTQQSNELMLK